MRALITNFESSRNIPTAIGDVFFSAGETREFKGSVTIGEIGKYPGIGVQIIKEKRPRPRPDFSIFKINELRAIAKIRGIQGYFKMTKKALIKTLQEA